MLVIFDKQTRQKGVKEYLEQGTKGDRNIKDKRVSLYGNLEITNKVAELGRKKGYKEAYRNIVLSFEESLDEQTLEQIAKDFIELYLYPYNLEEFTAYAEAHLPKRKINSRGYERKNHIHIVIPKYSLKLQQQLDLGDHARRLAEIEKIKEFLESKYNLKSLERKKIITHGKAEILDIQKYKDKNKTKKELENYIINNILHYNSVDDLINDLEKKLNAEIKKSKNARTPYISIKLPQFQKRIRLKGELFNNKNFEQVKQNLLNNNKYVKIKNSTKKAPKEILEELKLLRANRVERILKRIKFKREQQQKEIIKVEQTTKIKNYISYAEKLLNESYNYNFNLDLQKGFFVRKYNNTGYTLIRNKKKNIKVLDKGNKIVAQGKNLKEQAKIMIELAIAKGWDLQKLKINGGNEFKKITKKIIEEKLQEQEKQKDLKEEQLPSPQDYLFKENKQQNTYIQTKLHKAKEQQQVNKLDLKTLKEKLTAETLLKVLKAKELLVKDYEIIDNKIKIGRKKLNIVDFCLKEIHLSFKETSKLLNKIYKINLEKDFKKGNIKGEEMKLSYNTYTKIDYPTKNWGTKELKSKFELETLIKTYPYSPFLFTDGYRSSDNTAQMTALMLDFDNDNKDYLISMQEVANRLKEKGIKALLVETKSSNKEKNGVVAERFRVIIPITKEISISKDDRETYARAVENFANFLGLYNYIDKGALKDIARMYRPSPNSAKSRAINNNNNVDFENLLTNAKEQLIREQKEKEQRLAKMKEIESNISAYTYNANAGDITPLNGLTYADINKILNIPFKNLISNFEGIEKEYKEGSYRIIKTDTAKYSILENGEVIHDFKNNKTYNKISYLYKQLNVNNLMLLARTLQNITGEEYIKVNENLIDKAIKEATNKATTLKEFNEIIKNVCNVNYVNVDLKNNKINIADVEINIDTKPILNKLNKNKNKKKMRKYNNPTI